MSHEPENNVNKLVREPRTKAAMVKTGTKAGAKQFTSSKTGHVVFEDSYKD